eukprot:CAMPEP_0185031036 /NCGR_PEP_ID=MMETSP1103-20130426/18268_1 /TAXON_ID=36769 /ORGANISM="Paraphysomonas bandaiensis, Strain Caron Lab Isolate" /LENGTH=741 /DNA_ID=CAMNT_0027566391 /DNA_START=414 /DNA_END=2639 /DNA_ORIENTATION=+
MLNVERAVAQGDVASYYVQRDAECSKGMDEAQLIEREDRYRAHSAQQILSVSSLTTPNVTLKKGLLLFKRVVRQTFRRKIWKPRWFVVENKMLLCYHDENYTTLRRTMPLQDCRVQIVEHHTYENCFEVYSPITCTLFKLRASSESEMADWIEAINKVANDIPVEIRTEAGFKPDAFSNRSLTSDTPSPYGGTPPESPGELNGAVSIGPQSAHDIIKSTSFRHRYMSVLQRKRYKFFTEQRMFIGKITEICEELRFMERSSRKSALQEKIALVSIPSCCYLALCNSTDPWSRIIASLPAESHAFTTKARCPALLLFEMQDHPKRIDVATYLGSDELCVELEEDPLSPDGPYNEVESPKKEQLTSFFKEFDANTAALRRKLIESSIGATDVDVLVANSNSDDEIKERRLSFDAMQVDYTPPVVNKLSSVNVNGKHEESPDAEAEAIRETITPEDMEAFVAKAARISADSPRGNYPGWRLDGMIAKSNDDLRQEVFVMQMITYLKEIFINSCVPVWVHTYKIVSTSKSTGLIQLIPDSISLDGLKKGAHWPGTLRGHFERTYGPPESPTFKAALDSYIKSLAGYSVVSYVLAIKDRHNGNIMIDSQGHLIHIDFGFVFGLAPGKQFSMETAPWKLTEEMADVMGGPTSPDFDTYMSLTTDAFKAVRKYTDDICMMLEIMSFNSSYPAFRYNPDAILDLRRRMMLDVPDHDLPGVIRGLMTRSYKHTGTGRYDQFQVLTNGIAA